MKMINKQYDLEIGGSIDFNWGGQVYTDWEEEEVYRDGLIAIQTVHIYDVPTLIKRLKEQSIKNQEIVNQILDKAESFDKDYKKNLKKSSKKL